MRVLRVGKVRSGGHAYYLDVTGDDRHPGIEAQGRWVGRGRADLGLAGPVAGPDLEAVLGGAAPRTGEMLGLAHNRVTVAGFDLTFSAPKSVSLLHALSDPDVAAQVGAGHDAAVGSALDYVERHALAVRRQQDVGRIPVAAQGVATAGFVHRTSRALDPHLHTHVVMANLGRADGTWSALDGRGVYAHARAASALYHVQLRHELTSRLGVAWDAPDRGRADIEGIGLEARKTFSRRAASIAAQLAEWGQDGGRAAEAASHVTRPPKDMGVTVEELRPEWQSRASAIGLSPQRLDAVLGRVPARLVGEQSATLTTALASEVQSSLGESATRRDVVRRWCEVLPNAVPARAVEDAADQLLPSLSPVGGVAGRNGPGVAERRYVIEPPMLQRALASRGMDRVRAPERHRQRGYDMGMGLG